MTASSPRPAAPDTTGGELRSAIARAMTEPTDWRGGPDGDYWGMRADRVLALPALRDLLAERDKLAAQVQAVEGLAEAWEGKGESTWQEIRRALAHDYTSHAYASRLRRALGTPTTGGGE